MSLRILLCSESPLKLHALTNVLDDKFRGKFVINLKNCDGLGLPPQPYNCAEACCFERIMYARSLIGAAWSDYDAIIAIENGLLSEISHQSFFDVCNVGVLMPGSSRFLNGCINQNETLHRLPFDSSPLPLLGEMITFSPTIWGFKKTTGELLVETGRATDAKDWIKSVSPGNSRLHQIEKALVPFVEAMRDEKYRKKTHIDVEVYPNFPKPNVSFVDLFALTYYHRDMDFIIGTLRKFYCDLNVTAIVGLESRGFIVGMMLATTLSLPFIPIRKAGKLPGPIESIEYKTEYSTDKFEMQKFDGPHRVVVADDFVATGGSLDAANQLLVRAGHTVVDMFVLFEEKTLREKARATIKVPYTVFFDY